MIKCYYPLILIIVSLGIEGCSSKVEATIEPQKEYIVIEANNIVNDNLIQGIREGEVVRNIYVNRYIDPSNPDMFHEAHEVYIKSQSASWNHRPNPPISQDLNRRLKVAEPIEAEMNLQIKELGITNSIVKEFGSELKTANKEVENQSKKAKELVDKLTEENTKLLNQVEALDRQLKSISHKVAEIELKTSK